MAATDTPSQGRIASLLARLNPVPAFPLYTGPYRVGTVDIEVPVSELASPSPAPDNADKLIPTILCRVFYPAVDESREGRIPWLPAPQRHYVSAYTKFMGVGHTVAELLSFLPRHLHYASIPVHKNATMKQAETDDKRWPTMIFSHGLGGSRNSYSYIAGSLASHGVVVFCPEHRDGSAIATYVRVPGPNGRIARKVFPYQRISHQVTPEVYMRREAQLRIRLWEFGLLYEAMLALDAGQALTNLNVTTPSLDQFANQLSISEPGSVIFAGHSFGASTVYQLLKSTYYAQTPEVAEMDKPLFAPGEGSSIRRQITERTVLMLLDMWCLPLIAPNSAPLFNLPLPPYADVPSAPGGSALLAVESEAFFKWSEHLNVKARLLTPDPTVEVVTPSVFERPSGRRLAEPNFFYVQDSAHLSQSDFGVLFPWLTKKFFNAVEPERALRLNLRAQLQLLRANNVPVARTAIGDLIDGTHADKLGAPADACKDAIIPLVDGGLDNDEAIFDRTNNGSVSHWHWIDTIGLGELHEGEKGKTLQEQVEDGEAQMQGELEPSQREPPTTPALKGVTLPQGEGWREI
ncbi:Platelet-activating factor acetylhydrolase [Escovopsis weberi]|uniref:Putative phospholipase n=1 Tax=Escovopsis weberi TaxID=150374 RepID=A0A0M8MQC1_ESCWE|nr:Platelet-activating factor acetylhydrolase [Escovopsis weberi]